MKDPQDSQEADLRRAFVLMCRDGAEAKTARLELLRPHAGFPRPPFGRALLCVRDVRAYRGICSYGSGR